MTGAGGDHRKTVGSFTHKDASGANKVSFSGQLAKLAPGRYTLQATPRFHRQSGARQRRVHGHLFISPH